MNSTEGSAGSRYPEVNPTSRPSHVATEQVSASAQESAASTQEVAAASVSLTQMAGDLHRLVGAFAV